MSSIVPASQMNGALNAERYQTFEMAKAYDDVLASDNIAKIRTYAADARNAANSMQRRMAVMDSIEELVVSKSEVLESTQTLAKVAIFGDQRVGELLREMPKAKGNQYQQSANSDASEKAKADALKEAGIARSQAYDLEKLAANPEVVQAVIDKATAEGKVVSRSQVLKAIQERDDARAREATVRKVGEHLKQQVETLKQMAEQPQVIERAVEVVPDDYERTKERVHELEHEVKVTNDTYQRMRKKLNETRQQLNQANELLGENDRKQNARRDIEHLTVATNTYLRNYGGRAWAFDQFDRVDEVTQEEFVKAIHNLAAFAQNLSELIASKR